MYPVSRANRGCKPAFEELPCRSIDDTQSAGAGKVPISWWPGSDTPFANLDPKTPTLQAVGALVKVDVWKTGRGDMPSER
jgi:hypothetical protein